MVAAALCSAPHATPALLRTAQQRRQQLLVQAQDTNINESSTYMTTAQGRREGRNSKSSRLSPPSCCQAVQTHPLRRRR